MNASPPNTARRPLIATGIALSLAALGYLLLRGKDPIQALLFEENLQVLIGLAMLLICRLFLLFIAPGWLLYVFLLKQITRRSGPTSAAPPLSERKASTLPTPREGP